MQQQQKSNNKPSETYQGFDESPSVVAGLPEGLQFMAPLVALGRRGEHGGHDSKTIYECL
jgi:hypothetical protein